MAALRENRSYGLSGTLSRGENLSVFHVKLTDSAARAIDCFRNGKVTFLSLFLFDFRSKGPTWVCCCGASTGWTLRS